MRLVLTDNEYTVIAQIPDVENEMSKLSYGGNVSVGMSPKLRGDIVAMFQEVLDAYPIPEPKSIPSKVVPFNRTLQTPKSTE